MTSKATPITSMDAPSGAEGLQMPIIQDILDEIGQSENDFPTEMVTHETRDELNAPRLNYQMDPNINALPHGNYVPSGPTAMNMYQNALVNKSSGRSILSTVLKEVRLPVLVVTLFAVFHKTKLGEVMFKRLSFAMTEGNLNVSGTVLTALVFGLMFWGGKFALENININI